MNPTVTALLVGVMTGLSVLMAGCSFKATSSSDSMGTRNSCERDSDCGAGACRLGACVALSATLDALFIEVSMPAVGAGDATGVRYRTTKLLSEVTSEEGLDLRLDSVALISGMVKSQAAGCEYRFQSSDGEEATPAGTDDSIPVTATFIPRERLLGVAPLSYAAKSQPHETKGLTHRFDVRVAPGTYDVYLVPDSPAPDSCPVAPQLLLGQTIGAGALELSLPLPQARKLGLSVVVPKGTGGSSRLRGWTVDMIDPDMGHVLSTTAVLEGARDTDDGTGVVYSTELHYSPVWSIEANSYTGEGKEWVRFSPPDGVLAPTMLLSRSSLQIFGAEDALVDQLPDVFASVSVEGAVELLEPGTPVAAQLTFIATRLDGVEPGILASYVVNGASDEAGTFSVDLLPGSYRVRAVPLLDGCCDAAAEHCNCPSAVEVEWEVSGTPAVQAGRTIQLPASATVSGRVVSPGGGTGLEGATVELQPSPATTPQMDELLRGGAFTPRVASTVTGRSGAFTIAADPGSYRMWVWPGEDSGFSWLVMPNLAVSDEGSSPDVGHLKMPLPVAYRGKVTLPPQDDLGEPIKGAGAMVRAYAYLNAALDPVSNPSAAESAIPVSEARADEKGNFVLLIPDSLYGSE